ncbi:unnamed protein product, partial [Ectocarpus sp. 12 AP-2014]
TTTGAKGRSVISAVDRRPHLRRKQPRSVPRGGCPASRCRRWACWVLTPQATSLTLVSTAGGDLITTTITTTLLLTVNGGDGHRRSGDGVDTVAALRPCRPSP